MSTDQPRTPIVGVVMGSRSDWETMRHAVEILEGLGVPCEAKVVSAHRTPERLYAYAREAEGRGLQVLIAGAGGAAHLPGMLASLTLLPVLGVPVESRVLRGVDSLLSIVQMPRGVPVGTLAIGASGAANAGLLAAAILARTGSVDPRGPGPFPDRADRGRGGVARMSIRPDRSDVATGAGSPLFPPASLGVIGSGQLGRMFIQAAQRMGYRAGVLERVGGHAGGAGGPLDGHRPRRRPCRASDPMAIGPRRSRSSSRTSRRPPCDGWPGNVRSVRAGERSGRPEPAAREDLPDPARHPATRPGVRCATGRNSRPLPGRLGLPLILKTAASGYDGKGQIRVEAADRLARAWDDPGQTPCVAEGWVDFAAEVSMVVARGRDGRAACYPVGLNRHDRHILDSTIMPAPVGPIVAQEARDLALGVAQALDAVGVLCVEFFLTANGRLMVNEMAPRPHNSGHLTIEAAAASQFEQQVRALCGLPLAASDLTTPAAMVNLLGDLWIEAGGEPRWDAALAADPGVSLHLYGKDAPVPGRKMGHLTVLDRDPESALVRALAARNALLRRSS